ncbi:MAG: rRNA maturation RNAse YbeY [Candidatus Liptonbacteria bacterium]|nr:rRNA maturation RNAse YbeY [Candidatus Liptonbacteria bacterium]
MRQRNALGIERRLKAVLVSALKNLGIRNAEAAVFLVGGADLRKMKTRLRVAEAHYGEAKARYHKKKASREVDPVRGREGSQRASASNGVDVLSFAEPKGFPHPESKKRFLGEIYLNRGLRSDFPRLAFLLIHGLLHLLGYTHNKKSDTLKMQSLEKRLMRQVTSNK